MLSGLGLWFEKSFLLLSETVPEGVCHVQFEGSPAGATGELYVAAAALAGQWAHHLIVLAPCALGSE